MALLCFLFVTNTFFILVKQKEKWYTIKAKPTEYCENVLFGGVVYPFVPT